jgi:hypothetical protein
LVVAYPPSHPLFAEVVTALDDLERPGFVTRIRHLRQIKTPLGFTTRQITNAYRVHEPARGLGLIAMTLFATESNSWTPSGTNFHPKRCDDDFEQSERPPPAMFDAPATDELRSSAPRHRLSTAGSCRCGPVTGISDDARQADRARPRIGAGLRLTNRADPVTEIIAKKIIELAQQGEGDPVQLRERAIDFLDLSRTRECPLPGLPSESNLEAIDYIVRSVTFEIS